MFLGEILNPLYLQSNRYAPERMLDRINRVTSSMMENGVHNFYTSIVAFKSKIFQRIHYAQLPNDDMQALTAKQLIRPMILVFSLWGMAVILFIVEIIIFKWKKRNIH